MRIATKRISGLHGLDEPRVWDTQSAFEHLRRKGLVASKRTAERRLQALGIICRDLTADALVDKYSRPPNPLLFTWALGEARSRRDRVLFLQLNRSREGTLTLHANDARGGRVWMPHARAERAAIERALIAIQQHLGRPIAVFPTGELVGLLRDTSDSPNIRRMCAIFMPIPVASPTRTRGPTKPRSTSAHLAQLESEAIFILREAIATAQKPVMMYSIGKDSSVLLHLARKAFYPSRPPFPLLHIDTQWKFQEMYTFRDWVEHDSGLELIVHINSDAIERNINPFDHGSELHTAITKTEALKQALDQHRFDCVIGGARRDEEKSRAKERIFSVRSRSHQWDPKDQRPELWSLYNTRLRPGESLRVFPLSNWTELDIWQYIQQEAIPVVPLYFAKRRPVIVKPHFTMLVDDARCRLAPGDRIELRPVRFRTLGCYPLTGAIDSEADTLEKLIKELKGTHWSERQGRAIDFDSTSSMEKKKQEGYF